MSFIPRLIAIYAAHSVADVKNRPELLEQPFGHKLEHLSAMPEFSAQQDFVRAPLAPTISGAAVSRLLSKYGA